MKTITKLAVLFVLMVTAAFAADASDPQWQYASLTFIHTPKQKTAVLNLPKEQRTVEVREALGSNPAYRDKFYRAPEAKNDPRDATPSVIDLLNCDFGSNGWELVFVQHDEMFTVYTFKRKYES